MSRLICSGVAESLRWASTSSRTPVVGWSLITSSSDGGISLPLVAYPRRGGSLKTSRSSHWSTASSFPVRMKKGTPLQRQLSISRRIAANVSVLESLATPLTFR